MVYRLESRDFPVDSPRGLTERKSGTNAWIASIPVVEPRRNGTHFKFGSFPQKRANLADEGEANPT